MSWFFLALLATFFWACTIILDDNLLRNVYRTPHFAAAISGLIGALPVVYLLWSPLPQPRTAAIAMAAGALIVGYLFLYFRSFEDIQPSEVSALMNLIPAFVPFISYVVIRESLSVPQYVGLAIIVVASFALSAVDIKKFQFSRSIYFMILGCLFYAVSEVLAKLAYAQGGVFGSVYAFVGLGMGLGGAFFVFAFDSGRKFLQTFFDYKTKIIGLLIVAEVISVVALFFHNRSISLGPVAAVTAVEATLPAIVLAIAFLMYPFWPKYFREAAAGGTVKKVVLMFVMVGGLYLIYT
jgi:drug/metabolite transporter (DMT)-like permease